VLAGRDWTGGAAVVAVSTRKNDALVGADRDFPRQDLTPYGGSDFRVRTCAPGNVIVGATVYALPALTPGANLCDNDRMTAIMPWERQTSGFLSLTQEISPDLDFQVKAFGATRTTKTPAAQLADSAAIITAANPFFQPIAGESQQTLAFSWAPVLGPTTMSELRLKQFDVSPTLTWRMSRGWQARMLLDYGRSHLTQKVPQLNKAAEAAALRQPGLTVATALNPYSLPATSHEVLKSISDYWNFARSNQSMQTARAIADGPVFALAGGEVRVAVGAQVQHVSNNSLSVAGPIDVFDAAVTARRSRNIGGVFGELVAPLVGPGNRRPFVDGLVLDLSARFNEYEQIGSTLNPKVGLTWTVADGLKLQGTWGTAFVAPGLNDTPSGGTDSTVLIAATTTNLRPGDPLTDRNRPNIALTGGTAGVKPVTARTWSLGAEYRPERIEGLELRLNYWSIQMKNLIQAGCINTLADQLADPRLNGVCYFYRPTLDQALALTSDYKLVFGAGASVAALYGAGNDPYYIQDRRRRNYGGFNSSGLDFSATYRRPTAWGAIYGTIGGVRYLSREQQQVQGGPFVDLLAANNPRLALQALAGVDVGKFTATLTALHTGGYAVTSVAGQTGVAGFTPLNLFFRYAVDERLDLTLNVDNVADVDAPFINQSSGLAGSTIGRYVSMGVRKRF
jgi:iron complex outermembrane receptor protein